MSRLLLICAFLALLMLALAMLRPSPILGG